MPWDIENYYIVGNRVLCVEVTIPLIDFLYAKIDDVKDAWFEMLRQITVEQPELEFSWEMEPRKKDAIVTVRIAKKGELVEFTEKELDYVLAAADALFEK